MIITKGQQMIITKGQRVLVAAWVNSRVRDLKFIGHDEHNAYFTDNDSGDDVTISNSILAHLCVTLVE